MEEAESALEKYRLDEAAEVLYHFFWSEFCDIYLEGVKGRFSEGEKAAGIVALHILEKVLRLWHPIIPFVTEEIWHRVDELVSGGLSAEACIVAPWPGVEHDYIDDGAEVEVQYLKNFATELRNIKNSVGLGNRRIGAPVVVADDDIQRKIIDRHSELVKDLARVDSIEDAESRPEGAVGTAVVNNSVVYFPLEGLVDIDAEKARLDKEIDRLEGVLKGFTKRLNNEGFLKNAPDEVVENTRRQSREVKEKLEHLEAARKNLG